MLFYLISTVYRLTLLRTLKFAKTLVTYSNYSGVNFNISAKVIYFVTHCFRIIKRSEKYQSFLFLRVQAKGPGFENTEVHAQP